MRKEHLYRRKSPRRKEVGFVLLEAMIGVLIFAFTGISIAYAFNKLIQSQKTNNVLSTIGLQMREEFGNKGPSTPCTDNKNTLTLTSNIVLKQYTKCTQKEVTVKFGAGSSAKVSVPQFEYYLSNPVIGSIPYKISN